MKLIVKILRGSECVLDVQSDLYVSDLKKLIEEKLNVAPDEQKLLLTGKTLADDKQLRDYSLKDGSRINLIVSNKENASGSSKTEKNNILKQEMERFLLQYFSEGETKKIADEFMKEFYKTTQTLNLDDLERIACGYLKNSQDDV